MYMLYCKTHCCYRGVIRVRLGSGVCGMGRFKGVVHVLKKTFADNLLTPMSSKMFMSFYLQSKRN